MTTDIRRLTDKQAGGIAFGWGLAEATFFFLIPDIFLSYRALHSFRAGLQACGMALLGALLGGSIMYAAAMHNPAGAFNFVNAVPTVTAKPIAEVRQEYTHNGTTAVLYGPLKTAPYKLYAVLAPVYHIGYLPFIAISVVARLARFVTVTAIASAISRALKPKLAFKYHIAILTGCWVIVYALFFATHWI